MVKDNSDLNKYNSIDLTKFLMAILVIAIHTRPLVQCQNKIVLSAYNSILECAVPFFFISSGFLLEKKFSKNPNMNIIKKQVFKILKMYILWMIIYFPLEIYHAYSTDISLFKEVLSIARSLIFVGELYNSWHLWYLLSTLYGLILVYYFKSIHISSKKCVIICGIIMFVSFSVDVFIGINTLPKLLIFIQKIIKVTIINGRIFRGMFFIPIGVFLCNLNIKPHFSILFTVIGYLGNCIFSGFIGNLFLTICSIGLFELIVNFKLKDNPVYGKLRVISTNIYLIHMYVWTLYCALFYSTTRRYGVDSFLVTISISILLSICMLIKRTSKST